MFKKFLLTAAAIILVAAPSFADVIGSVDYQVIISNYSKAKAAYIELDDRASELQSFLLSKEKEFKKLDSPIQRKTFEEKTAKEFALKQEAFAKFKAQKEDALEKEIQNAIKAVAMENKVDAVIDAAAIFYGNVDLTDKVVKKLNMN